MAFVSALNINEALARGHQHYKLKLDNWGNGGTAADDESVRYDIERPIAGVQIAAESQVGECFVEFNTGGLSLPAGKILAESNNGAVYDQTLYVKRGRPYFFRTPAPIAIQASPPTMFGDTYLPVGGATPTTTGAFGRALGVQQFLADEPELVLLLFFDQNPSVVVEPSYPYEVLGTSVALSDANETLYRVFPAHHRQNLYLRIDNLSASDVPMEVRICGVRGTSRTLPIAAYGQYEFDLFSGPIIVPGNTRTVQPVSNPEAVWITTYARKQFQTGGDNSQIRMAVFAANPN